MRFANLAGLPDEIARLRASGFSTALMDRDERHAHVVQTFPGGLTPLQFAAVTLLSADADGVVDAPSVAGDFLIRDRLLTWLFLAGLIERRCRRDEAGPYFLSPEGRALQSATGCTRSTAALPAPAAGEWQPIETAPKDAFVLLWVDIRVGPPLVAQACWYQDGGDAGWIDAHGEVLPATRWMPLPRAPQGESNG